MTSVQEQYTETLKQGQEAVYGAVDTWTKTVQDAWGRLPAVSDPAEIVDRFYAVASQLLEVQRDLAKSLLSTTNSFTDTLKQQAQKAASAVEHSA